MTISRVSHTATLLLHGRVLIAGGATGPAGRGVAEAATSKAEIYDPSTRTFTATGNMTAARSNHVATRLLDGRVLITGGWDPTFAVSSSAELYEPSTGTFTAVGGMLTPSPCYATALLGNGKVLIVEGAPWSNGAVALNADLYDPASRTFAATGTPLSTHPRVGNDFVCPTATLLQTGKVLVTWNTTLAELYDSNDGAFTPTGSMSMASCCGGYTETLLQSGKVLIAGGESDFGTSRSADLYDPASGRFTPTGNMNTPRCCHSATLLRDGTALIVGAQLPGWTVLASSERFDPAAGTFAPGNDLITPRFFHTATLLDSGDVLVTGGYFGASSATDSAELYHAGLAPINVPQRAGDLLR